MGHNGMAQPTSWTQTDTVERLAALAIVVQRFTERGEPTLELSSDGISSRVVVPLDDDPTFTVLVDRIAGALSAGEDTGGEPDGILSVGADGNFTYRGAPDLPADLEQRVTLAHAGRSRQRRAAGQPPVAARSGRARAAAGRLEPDRGALSEPVPARAGERPGARHAGSRRRDVRVRAAHASPSWMRAPTSSPIT